MKPVLWPDVDAALKKVETRIKHYAVDNYPGDLMLEIADVLRLGGSFLRSLDFTASAAQRDLQCRTSPEVGQIISEALAGFKSFKECFEERLKLLQENLLAAQTAQEFRRIHPNCPLGISGQRE